MPNTRQADATLRGFHYQFLKTISEILQLDDGETVTVEGIVEDIDVIDPENHQTAIQCKYLESSSKFQLSILYKPLLQMLYHYSQNIDADITYCLFIYISDAAPIPIVIEQDVRKILASENQNLQTLINKIPNDIDINNFLRRFKIEQGCSLKELERDVKDKILQLGISQEGLEELFYPNAITYIGELSRKPTPAQRKVTKGTFESYLKNKQNVLYSRWSVLTKTKTQMLSIMRKQCAASLNNNARARYFIFGRLNSAIVRDIIDIVILIVGKYAYKPQLHNKAPIFFVDFDEAEYNQFVRDIHDQNCQCEVGGMFSDKQATKCSEYIKATNSRTFFFKVAKWGNETEAFIEQHPCNDLFIISSDFEPKTEIRNSQIYKLNMDTSYEVKYVLGVRDTYE